MSLHLFAAFQEQSIYNLQIRMPACILGAGLTAVDVATEVLAYYPLQVAKVYQRFHELKKEYGKEEIYQKLNLEERIILEEFLDHATLLKDKSHAQQVEILQSLGGVKILYHKDLKLSSAFRLNYSELQNALDEGVFFLENTSIQEIEKDQFNSLKNIKINNCDNQNQLIPARSLIIAVGNTINDRIETQNMHNVSVWGDMLPKYSGSVVKAMASVKDNHQTLVDNIPENNINFQDNIFSKIDEVSLSTVHEIEHVSDKIIQLTVHSPMAVKLYQPGQFFRLQNFAADAIVANETQMLIEPIAVTGAWVDKEKSLITFFILDVGASSFLCKFFTPGQQLSLMGPVGTPTDILPNENVLLVGGGVGNAVLLPIMESMHKKNCRITYFAGYRSLQDRFAIKQIEQYTNEVYWACDQGVLPKQRPQDTSYHGSIIPVFKEYITNNDKKINRIFICGSCSLMSALQTEIQGSLKEYIPAECSVIASINAPMQCMMGGVCGSCIQIKDNNAFFACAHQDQDLREIDLAYLNNKLTQNSLQEKITYQWVKHCMKQNI